MDRHELIQRYCGIRAWFDQLVAFVVTTHQALASDSLPLTQSDYDSWIAQMWAYQQVCCQRCGAFLAEDGLGLGAYAVDSFGRICSLCYDELTQARSTGQRRLARLTALAQEYPEIFAGVLVAAQRHLGLDDWQLEQEFGLDSIGVVRLALAPRPREDQADEDLAQIAQAAGCDMVALQHILVVSALAQPLASDGNRHDSDGDPSF